MMDEFSMSLVARMCMINIEVEAMKAANAKQLYDGGQPDYGYNDFVRCFHDMNQINLDLRSRAG